MMMSGDAAMITQMTTLRNSSAIYYGDAAVKLGRWVLIIGVAEIILFCILKLFFQI